MTLSKKPNIKTGFVAKHVKAVLDEQRRAEAEQFIKDNPDIVEQIIAKNRRNKSRNNKIDVIR